MRAGIVGGGQLAAMLTEALQRLGWEVVIYDSERDAPARIHVRESVVASFDDQAALSRFISSCDVVTYEREDLPAAVLRAALGNVPVYPSIEVLEIAQDRELEKRFLDQAGLPTVRHAFARGDELADAFAAFGAPAIVKTARGGYDGKGQWRLTSVDEAKELASHLGDRRCVIEEVAKLKGELSVVVARTEEEECVFPVFENLHEHHILDRTVVPARVSDEVRKRAESIALSLARAIQLHGLLCVELFLLESGELLVNEIAPRPHNSGHVTRSACTFSQFDALARLLVGAPIGKPVLWPGGHCMANLLGEHFPAEGGLNLTVWRDFPEIVLVYDYGKSRGSPRRKMGHALAVAATPDEAFQRASEFRAALQWSNRP